MSKIKITCDSTCDLTNELYNKNKVTVVPLSIALGDEIRRDSIDIDADEIFRYVKATNQLPKTSALSIGEYEDVFGKLVNEGYTVIHINLSSELSSSHQNACLAAEDIGNVYVVDSRNLSSGSGHLVLLAAAMAESGMEAGEIVGILNEKKSKLDVSFVLQTLEYLQKGGRIGLVTAMLGTALNLKPIISCNPEGIYYTVAKVRGRQQSIKKVLDIPVDFAGNAKKYNIALIGSGTLGLKDAASIREQVLAKLPNRNTLIEGELGCCLGVHVGPGLVGVGVHILED
ncbi:MAG: DegV family protein [Peptococcaceae bacterium]|nr:DegV family protein [Peptococcaceae bacterium]